MCLTFGVAFFEQLISCVLAGEGGFFGERLSRRTGFGFIWFPVSEEGSKGHAFRTSRMAPSVFLTLTALTALTLFQEMGPPPPRPRKWCPNTPSQSDTLWAVTWAQPCKHFRSLVNFHGRWMEGADAAMEAHRCSLCSLAPLEAFLVCQEDMADEETWATVPCYQRLSKVNSPRYNKTC